METPVVQPSNNRYQFTMLPNGNVHVAVISDEPPSKGMKNGLAQFSIDQTVTLANGNEGVIEGITMRSFIRQPYVGGYTTWEIVYYVRSCKRECAPTELELLTCNPSYATASMLAMMHNCAVRMKVEYDAGRIADSSPF